MNGSDPESRGAPTVERKGASPPGVLPRNIQAWVIGGIALIMVLAIAVSGDKKPKSRNVSGPPPGAEAVDPNQARIQEYRARIEEQARKLAAEQAQLGETKQALGLAPEAPPSAAGSRVAPSYSAPAPRKTWVEAEMEKRQYQSLFASNVALTYRQDPARGAAAAEPVASLPPSPATPSDPDASNDDVGGAASGAPTDEEIDPRKVRRDGASRSRSDATYRLFEGTIIETVLTNRLDGAFSGPVNCMVTTNVYSRALRRLLIPQGSRILGEVRPVETLGQQRLAVSFHRLIMPNGYSVSLDQFKGLNQVGETGLRDKINRHYLQIFGVSIAVGAIAGLGQVNTRYGSDASVGDAYRQGVASSLSQSSLRILDRYLNVLPTFTIREGHRVKIYLSNDLLLPAYEKHKTPGNP